MEPCGLPGLLVFVGGNFGRTWNELRRKWLQKGWKQGENRMDYLCGERGALCRERRLENGDGALLETCDGLYTVVYTVMYTVVYTVRTVSGALWRFFTNIYEQKRVENIKRISRYSTC